jgi:integrase
MKTGVVHWHARLTLKDGSRPLVPLDPSIPREDVARAKAGARLVSSEARTLGVIPDGTRETVAEYADRWHDWREGRGLQCVKDDRARMKNHVFPVIGPLDVRAVTRNDLEKLVERLDKRIVAGDLGWKVAGMAWSNVTRMFADACSAKRLDLRVRDDNPAKEIQAPERGTRKEKQYLWPSEFTALVTSSKVPLRWRRLFAIAVYTYSRAGEIEALSWEDVTFDNATLHIHQSVDRVRKRGKIKATKTGVSRRIPIEPNLYPLLRTLHDEADGKGRVIPAMPSPGMLSRKLKHYLERAGVKRAELFSADDTRKPITFHDLRATGITWMAARGDDPLRIKQRAGHSSFSTTEGYIREAENLGASFGAVFPELPDLARRSAFGITNGSEGGANGGGAGGVSDTGSGGNIDDPASFSGDHAASGGAFKSCCAH